MVVDPLDRGGVLLLLLLGLGLPILLRLVLLLGLLIKGLGRALRCLLQVAWRGRRLLVQLLHVKSVGVVQARRQLCMGHKRETRQVMATDISLGASVQKSHCPRHWKALREAVSQGQVGVTASGAAVAAAGVLCASTGFLFLFCKAHT